MDRKSILISFLVVIMVGVVGFLFAASGHAAPVKKFIAAIPQEPTSMDPSLSYIGGDYTVTNNIAEYPISRAPNGDLGPGLATSWKVSQDGKEIEFTLRKGVKFHSGDPLTTKDVKFSYERGLAKNTIIKTRLKLVERLEIIDDYHYKFHFKAPDVTFIPNYGGMFIVSKSYYDRVGEDKFVKEPVGTGPYKLVRYVPGEYVDFERVEDYWGEKPLVKEARFYFVAEDTTRVAKLKAGEVDFINGCPYPAVKDVEKSSDLKIIKFATNHPTAFICFSNQNPNVPWHDRRVRLAMAYAIDNDAIVKNVLNGLPNHWAWLAPYELGYDPNLKPYPYDPKKARELLSEAGYPKGFELKFYWPITARLAMPREVSEAIAAYWEAVGIRTRLVGQEWNAHLSRHRASKGPTAEYVGLYSGAASGAPDPTYYMGISLDPESAHCVYYNPDLYKLIMEATRTANESRRAEIIRKVTSAVHEDVAVIPVYNMIAVYAMKKSIDFTPTQKYAMDLILIKDVKIK